MRKNNVIKTVFSGALLLSLAFVTIPQNANALVKAGPAYDGTMNNDTLRCDSTKTNCLQSEPVIIKEKE